MSSVSGETPGRREHLFRGRRVKVRDLIDANLLKTGSSPRIRPAASRRDL